MYLTSVILNVLIVTLYSVRAQLATPPTGKAIGVPLPPISGNFGSARLTNPDVGIPLPPHPHGAPIGTQPTFTGNVGVALPPHTGGGVDPGLASPGNIRITGSTVGVPLTATSANGNQYTLFGKDGPILPTTVGRGLHDIRLHNKNFGPGKGGGGSTFRINELPTSIELDKSLSPVLPYFVFPDSDDDKGSLTIGGPKTGGLVPITNPTEDPKLLRLLSQPAVRQRLVAEAQADRALKISAILMAHRQVVGGQITYASVRVSETNCPPNRINSLRGCAVEAGEDSYICEIAFWERPWLNATQMLDEKTACRETETDVDFDNDDLGSGGSRLRALEEGKDIVGGHWRQTPTLPGGLSQQQLAVEAFNYVESYSDSKFRGYLAGHSVHSVQVDSARNLTKVHLQVDYGFTVCLKLDWSRGGQKDPRTCPVDTTRPRYSCSLSLLYHPSQLMPFRVVHGGDDKDELKCVKQPLSAVPPQTQQITPDIFSKDLQQDCSGCPTQAALSDPAIQAILKFAIEEYDKNYSDDRNLHKAVALLQAYTQATVGTKYVLTVEVAETLCLKNTGPLDRSQCKPDVTEETEICMFIVLHQPWLPSSHLLSADCMDKDEGQKLLLLPPASSPSRPTSLSAVRTSQQGVGVPLPSLSGLKPVPLTFKGAPSSTPTTLDPETAKMAQFIVDEINRNDLADDDFDSRGRDDSREFDDDFDSRGRDDSREFGNAHDIDGLYQLVKVHRVLPLNQNQKKRFVIEIGETNCSKSFLSRAHNIHCTLDPFEEHEVCNAVVGNTRGSLQLLAISCEDLGDYLEDTSLVPPVPPVTWEPVPFLPLGQLGSSQRLQNAPGFSRSANGPYSSMTPMSTSSVEAQKAAELVVARYNLQSGESELARLIGVLTAHTMTNTIGNMEYLLEVEIAETLCKKYQPIIDQNKCPVDPNEDKIVCQAEVEQGKGTNLGSQSTWNGLNVNKLYCREKEDYIVARNTGQEGPWTQMPATDPKLQELAAFTANEYDRRSDDDDLYILQKVVSGRYQNVSGTRYDIVVELAETICPKYKEHINKKRCKVDPTEDIKVCNAQLFESPSGAGGVSLTKLKCKERRPGSTGHISLHSREDNSKEVLVLPSVHPSAHARPVFFNKFKKTNYKVIRDDYSRESAESNEQFYVNPHTGTLAGGHRRGSSDGSRGRFDSRSEEDDSDEFLPRAARSNLRRGKRRRRDALDLRRLLRH